MKNKKWLHIITVAVILGFAVLALGSGTTQRTQQSGSSASSGSSDAPPRDLYDAQR